ncbi:MAG: class I SAM-dependent methyltransferase [Planctomycetes bacterium]|nr:class I SAM-dependent methyltransferase [Planctomycetota bacterium]
MPSNDWISTTTKGRDPTCVTRAQEVAQRCGFPYIERRDSVARLVRKAKVGGAYVVGLEKAELRAEGLRLAVHPSTLHHVRHLGRSHPFLRAVAPEGERVDRVVDATLGLAKDALHIATFLECSVVGLEHSPILTCLCEDGLARLGPPWRAGAARIEVLQAESRSWLAEQEADSAEVVVLDPMFETARPAAAGFDLLRRLACHDPLDPELLDQARRVASRRVVLKLPRGSKPPDVEKWQQIRGRGLDYFTLSSCHDGFSAPP